MQNEIVNDFSWKIAGKAGDGILNAGLLMFAKTCVKGGLRVFSNAEYPSLIRGGHNHLDVRVNSEEIHAPSKRIKLLIALNNESIEKHAEKVIPEGGIIYDPDEIEIEKFKLKEGIRKFPIPLMKLAKESGSTIMRNTVAIGATFSLTDFNLDLLFETIESNFSKKGKEVVENNRKAAKAGYDYVKENFKEFKFKLKESNNKNQIFLDGNDAYSLGAIKAGCKFYSAYPMTPATSILHNLAAMEEKYNIVVKQTEDELAAINMAIGAGLAGVRAMTGTSGGGFALMVEAFGMASQLEVPLVVAEVQRPGPATGLATRTGQGDLRYVMHAGTDEFPKIIVAPGDITECFYEAFNAFNLAEKYQMPVIVLTDKYIGTSYQSLPEFDTSKLKIERGLLLNEEEIKNESDELGFKRYKITESGISGRSIPGQEYGMYDACSYEHEEHGFEREEESLRIAMHDKRLKKMETALKEIPEPKLHGYEDAELTIVGWGTTKGAILEALKLLEEDGIKANFLQLLYIMPFHKNKVEQVLKNAKQLFIVENNKTAQLAGIIREETGIEIKNKVLKYSGRQFFPEEIYEGIKEKMNK